MAGDWIKMRGNLWDDPRVAALVEMTDTSEAAVVGALYWLWATADQHTEDGFMPGLTLRQIDRKTGVQGLGKALCGIGWLAETSDGVCLLNFTEHNGASAKRRATDAQRKGYTRKMSAPDTDNCGTNGGQDEDEIRRSVELEKEKEKEKNKEETPQPPKGGRRGKSEVDPDGFAEFWTAYPRKVAKDDARKAFAKRNPTPELVSEMVAAIGIQARSEQWRKDGGQFIPYPATWLSKGCWKDEPAIGVAGSAALSPSDPLMVKAAALPPEWWKLAGFESKWDAEGSQCNWMNYTEFRDRKRVAQPEGAAA
ncbi:hypothetical protein G7048_03845 [Diaphorobacter sp. HDW4B]|uniref:hypothetical protein n=1 Tax=Diaphorobacter sp. HDW4B TaxID=2714925 RepID=UPI00140CDDBA|nr:hypothetical protein [Diaphorobacter sp. HDW4B]QIL69581.1 hypothetical protein G7048_03845 [Diaphorobacter sp. HDW4B]